jgi:hypothetical protein
MNATSTRTADGRAAVIGEPLRISGYGLAGALLCPASSAADAVRAWRDLPRDVAVVLLTPDAAGWLGGELGNRPGVLPVVMPDAPAEVVPG